MPIPWTKTTRKKLHGFVSAHKADPKDQAPPLDEAWELLRTCRDGRIDGLDEHVEVATSVRDEFQSASPPKSLSLSREMYRCALAFQSHSNVNKWEGWAMPRALMSLWCEVEGPSFAIELLNRAPAFDADSRFFRKHEPNVTRTCGGCGKSWSGSKTDCCGEVTDSVDEHVGPWGGYDRMGPVWWALRARASVLDAAGLEALVSAASPFLVGLPARGSREDSWYRRSALLFSLSRAPEVTVPAIERLFAKAPS